MQRMPSQYRRPRTDLIKPVQEVARPRNRGSVGPRSRPSLGRVRHLPPADIADGVEDLSTGPHLGTAVGLGLAGKDGQAGLREMSYASIHHSPDLLR